MEISDKLFYEQQLRKKASCMPFTTQEITQIYELHEKYIGTPEKA